MSKAINKAYLKYFVTCDMTYIRSAIKIPKKKRKRKDAQLLTRSKTIKQTSSNQLSIIK